MDKHKWSEVIRTRPGMWVGELSFAGFKEMFLFLFEDLLALRLNEPVLQITFQANSNLMVEATGFDIQKFSEKVHKITPLFDNEIGYGLYIVAALSERLELTTNNAGKAEILNVHKGEFALSTAQTDGDKNSIIFSFTPDEEIFRDIKINYQHFNTFLQELAYLNAGLKIISIDHTTEELQRNIFHYSSGIFAMLDHLISRSFFGIKNITRVDIDAQRGEYTYKISILRGHITLLEPFIKTYANNTETFWGGSLNDGIIKGISRSIKKSAKKHGIEVRVRKKSIKEYFTVLAAIKGNDFTFIGSIKRKLGMPNIEKDATEIVSEELTKYINDNPTLRERFLDVFR